MLGFYISPTAKVIRRRDLGLVSSKRLEKPGIELTTPGLEGKWLNHYTTEASVSSCDLQKHIMQLIAKDIMFVCLHVKQNVCLHCC